jgi:hypothetical protein
MASLTFTQKIPYTVTDASGVVLSLPAGASISVVSSDTTVVTIVPDATTASGALTSGFIVPASPEKDSTATITATLINPNGTVISVTGSVSVVSGQINVTSLALNLGAPVSQ